MNSYAYARNNPVTYSDPDGKFVPLVVGALFMYAPTIISAAEIGLASYFGYQTAKTAGNVAGTAMSSAPREYKNEVYKSAIEDAGALYSVYQGLLGGGRLAIEENVRVGRWMSQKESGLMNSTGKIQEGKGGITSVSINGPKSYLGSEKGSVYREFDAPKNSLVQGGKDNWYKLVGKGANEIQQSIVQKQGGQLLQNLTPKNLSSVLKKK